MKYRTPLILSTLAAAVLYAISVVLGDVDAVISAIGQLTVSGWAAILGLSLVNYLLRYWRWQNYIKSLSGIQIPHSYHLTCYLAGFALTTTPGKAGEATRSVYLKPQGVGWNESISAFFVERVLDLFAILLLSISALLVFPDYNWVGYITATLIVILLGSLHSKLVHSLLDRLANSTLGKLAKAGQHLIRLLNASVQLLRPSVIGNGMVLGIISWACEGFALYLILLQLDVNISIPLAIGIYAAGILAGALSFIPGGLGSTEAVMTLMLMASGVDSSIAIAATLLCRVATLWFAVLIGLICMAMLARPASLQQQTTTEKQI